MDRDDDESELAPAARRGEHLLSRFVLEGLALSDRIDDESRAVVLDVLLGTATAAAPTWGFLQDPQKNKTNATGYALAYAA